MSKNKKEIDLLREGGGSINVNTPDDDSEITEMISVNERMLIVKAKGIFEVKLADEIDPLRTNIDTPNTVQKIIPFGTDNPWVCQVILTANKLFNEELLEEKINCGEAMVRIWNIAEDVSASYELENNFHKEQLNSIKGYDLKINKDRSVILPAINNVEVRCNELLQKADHALAELFKIVRIFYPDVKKGGWDSLKKKIDEGPKVADNFSEFLDKSLPFLHLVRNARNCVEHPKENMKIVTTNFSVNIQNDLLPPMVGIVHPDTLLKSIPVLEFFQYIISNLVGVIELMIVFLCSRHTESTSAIPAQVSLIPEKKRKFEYVRYGYTVMIGGEIVPMS